MNQDMKKLTVGDNSGLERKGDECHVVRTTIADIAIGERVAIRFKDDYGLTPYRVYELVERHFKDEWDAAHSKYSATFRLVKADTGAAILGALVALVVGAMGVGTLLLGLSIVTGRALI